MILMKVKNNWSHPTHLTVEGIGQKNWSDFHKVTYLASNRTVSRTKDVLFLVLDDLGKDSGDTRQRMVKRSMADANRDGLCQNHWNQHSGSLSMSETGQYQYRFPFHHLFVDWIWACYLTDMSSGCLIYNMDIRIAYILVGWNRSRLSKGTNFQLQEK